MAHNEIYPSGVSHTCLGLEWNAADVDNTTYTIAPTVWRWDEVNTANTGGRFSESLSPDPSGAGYWSGLSWGTGYGWRCVDTFAKRTYTKGRTAQTVKITVTTDASYGTYWYGWVNYGTKSVSWTLTIPAKPNYSVTYNANGGSGAPSAQTKYYGESLTLSSTVPTRTGYSFNGWNTNSSGTGTNYAKGASYTGNAALSLYAKWTANTWTVSFDANGGSGAPSAQTKTYGQALTLSSTKPTRTNYVFKGWATAANASAAQYCTGANNTDNTSFTTDATTTLYAVWELAYIPPKITNLKCFRCDANGGAADEGTRCYVSFTYAVDTILNSTTNYATVTAKVDEGASETLVQSSEHKIGTNTYEGVLAATDLDVNTTHTVYVTLSDVTGGSSYAVTNSAILSQAFFTIDVLAEGHGIGIGKPATIPGLLDVGMDANFGGDVSFGGNAAVFRRGIDLSEADNGVSEHLYSTYGVFDVNNVFASYIQSAVYTSGTSTLHIGSRNICAGDAVSNSMAFAVGKNGTRTITVSDIGPWLKALFTWGQLSNLSSEITLTTSWQKIPLTSFAGNGCSASSNGIKVPSAGMYLIWASAYLTNGYTQNDLIHIGVHRNSENVLNFMFRNGNNWSAPYSTPFFGPSVVTCSANDVLYMYAYNQDGARGKIQNHAATGIRVFKVS